MRVRDISTRCINTPGVPAVKMYQHTRYKYTRNTSTGVPIHQKYRCTNTSGVPVKKVHQHTRSTSKGGVPTYQVCNTPGVPIQKVHQHTRSTSTGVPTHQVHQYTKSTSTDVPTHSDIQYTWITSTGVQVQVYQHARCTRTQGATTLLELKTLIIAKSV